MEIQAPDQAEAFNALTLDLRAEQMNTVIGRGMVQTTSIDTNYGLLVLGTLRGDVRSESGTVFVEESGTIEGNIHGKQVLIAGKVVGNLRVEGVLYLTDTAHVIGDIEYGEIALMSDANIDGSLKKIR